VTGETRRRVSIACVVLLTSGLSLGVITAIALEGNEVVVLRTRGSDGSIRETRTWIADEGGASFVEAAHAARPFYLQLLAEPEIEVRRAGRVARYRAEPVPNPQGHAHIRRLLSEKYGWADDWIALLQDTSQSIEVRLTPR
jgi:hypothetical protein